jgi:hypothetical protein
VPSDENNSMLSSFSGIAQKLLGINPENTAVKAGLTILHHFLLAHF